ncbi:hypothetical protein PV10_01763 [Exophiala mesophila]|uniref:Uncharacterized protein n=1 Tax=Exophiala mesophila TaxID=212818 RepID=A0A0D2AGM8_EXOME|nr:uncharacterized protein PV10_01763 [Exophiala mesophila]KIV98073.1 hypothetical protein PV10_01763 [Exophiala mesophila]
MQGTNLKRNTRKRRERKESAEKVDHTMTAAKSAGKEIEAAAFLVNALAAAAADAEAQAVAAAAVKVTTAGGDTATSGSLDCARHQSGLLDDQLFRRLHTSQKRYWSAWNLSRKERRLTTPNDLA